MTPRDPGSFASSRWPWATWLSGTQKAAGPLTRCSLLYLSLKPHLFSGTLLVTAVAPHTRRHRGQPRSSDLRISGPGVWNRGRQPRRPGGGRASVCAGCGRVRDVTVSAPAAACKAPQRRHPTPQSAGSRRTRSASWSARSGTAERALRTDRAPPHRALSPCRKLAVPQKHPSTVSQRPRGKAPPTSRSGTGALGTGYRGKRRCIQTRFCCGRHR